MKYRLTAFLATLVALLCAAPAMSATVPLGSGQTFNAACTAAASGDTVTVAVGNYPSQTISCSKAVTFKLDPNAVLPSLTFSNATGPTVDGGKITGSGGGGGVGMMSSTNVTLKNATITNLIYIEGASNNSIIGNKIEPAAGGTTWDNGDMLDVYEQSRSRATNGVLIEGNVFHGLRSPTTTAHPDAIQFCNCDGTAGDSKFATNVVIRKNKFYDNECMNIRTNPHTGLTLEQNIIGDSVSGISGCGYYSLDVGYADVNARYNVFTGSQQIQQTPTVSGLHQVWTGNAGVGFSNGCTSGGAAGSVRSRNVWSGQTCGGTDKKVTSLGIDSSGVPTTGSPLIDAGDTASYPATDFAGAPRYQGAAPDAGAFETGGTVTPPPTDTTAPDTTITTAPTDGESTSATIAFTSTESGSTFECKLDAGTYAACTTPKSYTGLSVGTHTFSVRATDIAGNTDASPATTTWTVQAPPPPADDDADGVPNSTDACPALKGSRSDGCPSPTETIKLASDLDAANTKVTQLTADKAALQADLDAALAKIQKALADLQ